MGNLPNANRKSKIIILITDGEDFGELDKRRQEAEERENKLRQKLSKELELKQELRNTARDYLESWEEY